MVAKAKGKSAAPLACLDVQSWRVYSSEEMSAYLKRLTDAHQLTKRQRRKGSALAVRTWLRPVDIYCYLKARFGVPNGFQNFLRRDDSDNLIHWDFNLKAGSADIYILGMSREVHFMLSERLTDRDWKTLTEAIKADFGRVAKRKSLVLKSMEKWVLFPNKFAALADVCAELHEAIAEEVGGFQMTNPTSRARGAFGRSFKIRKAMSVRAARLYGRCIQLALLTPVLAEAFLNLLILVTCKRSIKNNARQFDAFVRSHIDTKIFDLPYKCENFAKGIDAQSDSFKNFKRVMDKRNHAVHGNIDPEREQIETVYFEGKRPLFEKAGDHIGNFMASLERQYEPDVIVKDYEDVHLFLLDLLNCVEERQREGVLTILSDAYPGYDVGRKICGHLFPDYVVAGYFGGMRYDDELKINRK